MNFDLKRKFNFTVSDEIFCELGKVVVFQSHIEEEIKSSISDLLQIDSRKCQIITSELSFKQLIGLLSSLIVEKLGKPNPLYSDYLKIKKKLYAFEEFRNLIAHSIWSHSNDFSQSKAIRFKITSKEKVGLKYQNEEIELKNIIQKLELASDTLVELVYFMAKITERKIKQINVPRSISHLKKF